MKIYRRALYAAVAVMTLAIGLGTVNGARLASAAVRRPADASVATPATERPMAAAQWTEGRSLLLDPASARPDDAPSMPFDPIGDYALDTATLPKAFADLEYLTLEVSEYYEQDGEYLSRPIVPRGAIHGKKEFKFSRIAIGGRELTFQTRTVGGISYRFVGRFPVPEEAGGDEEEVEGSPSLVGKLIKIRNGKWEAAMEAKFYLYHGC